MAPSADSPVKERKSKKDKKEKKLKTSDLESVPATPADTKNKKRKRPSLDATTTESLTKESKKARRVSSLPTTTTSSSSKPALTNLDTPYSLVTASLFVSLPPRHLHTPHLLPSHLLTPLLLTYSDPLAGIPLSFTNASFTSSLARVPSEAPFPCAWITADFLVWRPRKGMVLSGWVRLQGRSHLGLLVENMWNVMIPREKMPEGWRFEESEGGVEEGNVGDNMGGEGGWRREDGGRVEGRVGFVVEEVRLGGSVVVVEGSLRDGEKIREAERKWEEAKV